MLYTFISLLLKQQHSVAVFLSAVTVGLLCHQTIDSSNEHITADKQQVILYTFFMMTYLTKFLSMPTFMSCLCSVLHPTNYVNYKEMLIYAPAFGNEFPFYWDTVCYLLALHLAFCTAVKAAVGTAASS
jgi:hypothetical protein